MIYERQVHSVLAFTSPGRGKGCSRQKVVYGETIMQRTYNTDLVIHRIYSVLDNSNSIQCINRRSLMRVPTNKEKTTTGQSHHNMRTNDLRNITAYELDGNRLLQVQNSDHEAVLLRPLDVLLNWKRSPGKPRLHGQTSNLRILVLCVVLDMVDMKVLEVLVYSKNQNVSIVGLPGLVVKHVLRGSGNCEILTYHSSARHHRARPFPGMCPRPLGRSS